ncbi:ATP-dependent RecD-like DNA helicase [Desulfoluna limicola]|uniref:ATP-dependent RecD-like DNA helicase n=1 Tax=Desulfoluna limicola TaxID=2810562 RepID=A0ABM7PJD6_9BACT|nr:ATP-dependent RecD-like DNA helicase [Desulfoluna limicola]BCS97681.1 ATP-dependent RecD-like DNA helicase [Desulfoluna limicola]
MTTLTLSGRIKRIRYRNDDNSYTIAELVTDDTGVTIIVVGILAGIGLEDRLRLTGSWEKHTRFGDQFRITEYDMIFPETGEEIRTYLKRLGVKSLSNAKIRTLVERFGSETLEVIETTPEKVTGLKGFGKVTVENLREALTRQMEVKRLISFLKEHGIPVVHCAQIHKCYGTKAAERISGNPFDLLKDVPTIDFSTVDQAASALGIAEDDPRRLRACLLFALGQFASEGHVFAPRGDLLSRCMEKHHIEHEPLSEALSELKTQGHISAETLTKEGETIHAIYPKELFLAEQGIARRLAMMLSMPEEAPPVSRDEILETVLTKLAIKPSEEQLVTLEEILCHRVAVITGGPGTGKTTLVRSIAALCDHLRHETVMAAPTGRAARRITEVTGKKASTIHKLLKFDFKTGAFEHNRDKPLEGDVFIIDEVSMVDTLLMHRFLDAVPVDATVVFVGDIFQLPSVGPGNVLSDLIDSGRLKTYALTRIFRQAQESPIIMNAHRVRKGEFPDFEAKKESGLSEFYFIETGDPVKVMERVVELCTNRIPTTWDYNPLEDIQVLTPMHKGDVGTISLNNALQKALNAKGDAIESLGRTFRKGDKVMHLKNNYEKDVFNGDIGIISDVDKKEKTLEVDYEGRKVAYETEELDELTLAYAISVHKSQGSEYPAVVVPVTTQHYALLQRNLLYTAMTRGKELVILIGTRRAMEIALANNRPKLRLSYLDQRLAETP